MPERIVSASESALQDTESIGENKDHIIRREFTGPLDCCKVIKFNKNLEGNIKKLKSSPKMVKDFCEEVKIIVQDMNKAFDENNYQEDSGEESKVNDSQKDVEKTKAKKGEKDDEKTEENKKGKDGKKKEDKKPDYQKELKMDTIGLADIDKIFKDVSATLNRVITNREKLQTAKESFEKIMKTMCNFDGKKELKEYINELKKKAKEDKIHIYVDFNDGHVKLESIQGVDPPAPYRNAVKALNDVKSAAKTTVDLAPDVDKDLESCAKDIVKIEPVKDFKKLVSGTKDLMALHKKIKAFNENRKKVQKAPQVVKELFQCVKGIIVDIGKAFSEDEDEEENKEKQNDEENEKETGTGKSEQDSKSGQENKDEEEESNGKQEIEAIVHAPRKNEDATNEQENKNIVV